MGWLQRLSDGLTKTRNLVRGSVDRLIGRAPDPLLFEELEASLLAADLGVHMVERLMDRLKELSGESGRYASPEVLHVLKETILETLRSCEAEPIERLIQQGRGPFIILAVGVNGAGKTTTLAKLSQRFRKSGRTPLLIAADTFRAAAIEQIDTWGKNLGVEVIRHRHGADPAAVVFDGLAAAKAREVDVVLVDTAGRLHTKVNLMDELRKIKRVLTREVSGAPHEVLLILDATVGQNALSQARQFHDAIGVTGLALTKLDGTARGGIVVAIAEELKIPVRLLGVGEGAEDLQDFHAREFVDALFERA
jgi:fused signal recognition particle receptor